MSSRNHVYNIIDFQSILKFMIMVTNSYFKINIVFNPNMFYNIIV